MKKKGCYLLGVLMLVVVFSFGFSLGKGIDFDEEKMLTTSYLNYLQDKKKEIIIDFLAQQKVEEEIVWSRLIVQNNQTYLLYEFQPLNEEYAKYICYYDDVDPKDYDYMGYLRLQRTSSKKNEYEVVEWRETSCYKEGKGISGYHPENNPEDGYQQFTQWYDSDEFVQFGKVYTEEIETIEYYDDDMLLKATYHVGDKDYYFIALQNVRNVSGKYYDKNNNLVQEIQWKNEYPTLP